MTRSAFAGQQRYGANTWTGDIQGTWDSFKRQIPAGLNFSLSAIPNWNTDIGGFFLGEYPKKLADPDYKELYVRWLQFGAFCPMMRSHGADAPREIYQFGKKESLTMMRLQSLFIFVTPCYRISILFLGKSLHVSLLSCGRW